MQGCIRIAAACVQSRLCDGDLDGAVAEKRS